MSSNIVRILPLQFVHILDKNLNVTLVECGPLSRALQSHEELIGGPFPFVVVPPGHFCVVKNPCIKYEAGRPTELRHGEKEVRLYGTPFPLYPGECLAGAERFGVLTSDYRSALKLLPVIPVNEAIRLEAVDDFTDGEVKRATGEQWQVNGPCVYIPTPNAEIIERIKAQVIKPNETLRLRAKIKFIDSSGRERVTGEEWLVHEDGAYLPGPFEDVVKLEPAIILTPTSAVHLKATQTTVDCFGNTRKAGEQWTVTLKDTETLHAQIGVVVTRKVEKTVLGINQYCFIENPVDKDGDQHFGRSERRCGPISFFIQPDEFIPSGIAESHILQKDEAVVLQAQVEFIDETVPGKPVRLPGEKWMVRGPKVYTPCVEVTVLDVRKSIPLTINEGIYVRDIKTGQVRVEMGQNTYMLTENEVLFEKILPQEVEQMLRQGGGIGSETIRKIAYFEQSIDPQTLQGRNKSNVVSYRCPHNTATQVLNHVTKTSRVIFGPDLVILGPDEHFNVLSLSAGKPKKEGAMKSLALMLGPDFTRDIIEVETLDHARLKIEMAFNNYFKVDKSDPEGAKKIFAVPDFIGFACRQIGSRIRGTVAQISFDEFHRHSSMIIQAAVFGVDKNNVPLTELTFHENQLVVTSIDVQSIEPVDMRMRDSLAKSIQMAIEIATQSIEQSAQNDARCLEQKARGELERAKLLNEKEAEKERCKLLELRAVTAAVESAGQAVAEAQAKKESMIIECESQIIAEKLKAEAAMIEHAALLETQQQARTRELEYMKACNKNELHRAKELADIEVQKFKNQVKTLGVDTIRSIATAGPELQLSLLKGLGLKSILLTDGKNPINLFDTINGLVSAQQ